MFFFRLFPIIGYYKILSRSCVSILYVAVCLLLIPHYEFIPFPALFPFGKFVFCVCESISVLM